MSEQPNLAEHFVQAVNAATAAKHDLADIGDHLVATAMTVLVQAHGLRRASQIMYLAALQTAKSAELEDESRGPLQ